MSMQEFELLFRVCEMSFGINKQVMAVLGYLAYSEVEGIQPPEVIQTFPMHLDGKIGVTLMFKKHDDVGHPWLLIHIGEASDSEDLILRTVTVRALYDKNLGPCYADFKGARLERLSQCDILGAETVVNNALLSFML